MASTSLRVLHRTLAVPVCSTKVTIQPPEEQRCTTILFSAHSDMLLTTVASISVELTNERGTVLFANDGAFFEGGQTERQQPSGIPARSRAVEP